MSTEPHLRMLLFHRCWLDCPQKQEQKFGEGEGGGEEPVTRLLKKLIIIYEFTSRLIDSILFLFQIFLSKSSILFAV